MNPQKKMKVTGYVLREIEDPKSLTLINTLSYHEILNHPDLRQNYLGFTTVMYNPHDGLLYCGLCSFSGDIFYTFNPKTKAFRSLRYHEARGAEKYDVKIHRSLCLDDDGMIYGATAGLHRAPEYNMAPGGKLFRYDPRTDTIEILAIPLPHLYIQSIALDSRRKILYGCTYPEAHLFRYDLKTGISRDLGLILRDPHRPVVDREGNLWACWESTYPTCDAGLELLRYQPDPDRLDFGPWPESCKLIRHSIDDMELGPDGLIYIGGVTGDLLRLNPKTREMEHLGKPFHGTRMDTRFGPDGLLYLSSGYGKYIDGRKNRTDTGLFTYNPAQGTFEFHGYIFDENRQEETIMVHDIAVAAPGLAYVAESDNPRRSCSLWECYLNQ